MEQTQTQPTCTFPNEKNKEIFDLLRNEYQVNKNELTQHLSNSYRGVLTNQHVNMPTNFGRSMQKIIGYTILLILDQCGIEDNKRILKGLRVDGYPIKIEDIEDINNIEDLHSLFKKTTILGNFFEKEKIVNFLDGSNNTLTLDNKELKDLTTVTDLNKSSNDTQTAGNKKTKKRTKKKKKSKSKKAKKSKSKSKGKKTKSKTKKRRHRRRR